MKKTLLYKAAAVLTLVALALVISFVPRTALADVTGITFSPAGTQHILVGGTVTVSTTLTTSGTSTNPTYSWSASPSGVVNLSSTTASSVTFTGLTVGTATISLTVQDDEDRAASPVQPGATATYTIVVDPMTISPNPGYVALATPLTLTPASYTGSISSWVSSNPAVATVSSLGVVTGVSSGSTVITATNTPAGGAPTQTATTTVYVPTVTLSPVSQTLAAASNTTTIQMSVTNGGTAISNGSTVTWSSSDPSIGTLSSTSSTVSGGASSISFTSSAAGTNGTTTITASVGGITRTATVTVSTVRHLEITGPTSLNATTRTGTYTVYLKNADGTVYDDDTSTVHWSWSSSYLSITSDPLNSYRADMHNGEAHIQLYARYNTPSSGTRLYSWINSDYDNRVYHTITITGLSSLPQTGQDMTLVYVFGGLGAALIAAAGIWYGIRKKRTAA